MRVWRGEYSRHQGGVDGLEEGGGQGQESTQIATDAGAQGEDAGEQSHDAKEEGNQHEGEHEAGHQEVGVVVVDEVLRHPLLGVKGPVRGGIKRVCRMDIGVVLVSADSDAAVDTADVPI